MGPDSEWDAVVVGSGHNGLVAANYLADRGWSVLVLEAADRPGGAVASVDGFVAPGYVTDLYSAFYPLAAVSRPLSGLHLGKVGLRWSRAPEVLAHLLPDGRAAVLSRDAHRTAESVEQFARGDGARWLDLADEWARVGPPLMRALLGPFPPVRAATQLATAVGPGGALRLARTALASAWEWTAERFAGQGGRLLVAGNAAHADLAITAPGSAAFGWVLAMLAQTHGFPVPVGGSGRLTDALVDRLRSQDGRVLMDQRVERILLDGNSAVGVRTESGREIFARHVLADVDAPTLYGDLVGTEKLPSRLAEDLGRFSWDPSTVKVNWALDGPVPWRNEAVRSAGTVHLSADMTGLADYTHALATDRVPAEPFILLGQMTTADSTRSPAGTESVWAYTHLPHREWQVGQAHEVADRMQQVVERHAPGFTDRIVGRVVQEPADLASGDANLRLGAINAGTAQLFQQLVLRPTPGLGRPETFIDRLYLAGASAHPGGGVHGACGHNAARAALLRDHAIGGPMGRVLTQATRRLGLSGLAARQGQTGGCGSYWMPRRTSRARSTPASRATRWRAMSIPAETPAAVMTSPSSTNRSSGRTSIVGSSSTRRSSVLQCVVAGRSRKRPAAA